MSVANLCENLDRLEYSHIPTSLLPSNWCCPLWALHKSLEILLQEYTFPRLHIGGPFLHNQLADKIITAIRRR